MEMRRFARFRFNSCFETAQEIRDLGPKSSRVDMRLVDRDVTPIPSKRFAEQRSVFRSEKKILEHRIICKQNIRRLFVSFRER